MIRFFLLTFCLLAAHILSAQSSFYFGILAYPNYSGPRLVASPIYTDDDLIEINAREKARFSYSAGGFLGWKGEKVGIQFGLNYMETGFRTTRNPIPDGEERPNGASEKREAFINTNIELPIELVFSHELNEKNDLAFTLGTSFLYNLSNTIETTYYNGERLDTQTMDDEAAFNSFNYAFQTSFGWEHRFNSRYSLLVQPTFQFWLRQLQVEADLNHNLYNLGVRVGVKMKPYAE